MYVHERNAMCDDCLMQQGWVLSPIKPPIIFHKFLGEGALGKNAPKSHNSYLCNRPKFS